MTQVQSASGRTVTQSVRRLLSSVLRPGHGYQQLKHRLRPRTAYRAKITFLNPPAEMSVGGMVQASVVIQNVGTYTWRAAGGSAVQLASRWFQGGRREVCMDGPRVRLPHDVNPGQEVTLICPLHAPNTTGAYVLEVDLLQERIAWFQTGGSEAAQVVCAVTDYRARITLLDPPATMGVGDIRQVRVVVRNVGTDAWRAEGRLAVQLASRWFQGERRDVFMEGPRVRLPHDVRPGQEVPLTCLLQAPNTTGAYVLEVDLLREYIAWFRTPGSEAAQVACTVTGKVLDDFGTYEAIWKRQDLKKDYWSVVGPNSKDEFDQLGQGKLDMLVSLGLTPNCRVLDVGCGTGCLTRALMGFLTDQGLYYGTDIGPEGVDFCRQRYRRPNFHFLQNGMTALPIQDVSFDWVVFYSVFTHTYPQETVALLKEAKRLLRAGGTILGDVFLSSGLGAEPFTGNRAQVIVNEQHFYHALAETGLRAEAPDELSSTWNEGVRRVVVKFRR